MPRYNVEADGEWACFSSVCDAFVTPFMPLDKYEEWRDEEYGNNKNPLMDSNTKTLRQCLFFLSLNNSPDSIIQNLTEAGLMCSKEELGKD